jgi:hypothetical protein
VRHLRISLVLAALAVALGLLPGVAEAHSGKQSYVYLSLYDDGLEGRIEVPARDIEPILGFEVPQEEGPAREVMEERGDEVIAYFEENLTIGDGTTDWDIVYDGFDVLVTPAGTYIQLPFVVDQDFGGAPPRSFVVDYSGVIEANPEKDALLLIEHDWRSATFNNEAGELLGFSTGRTEQTVVVDDASTLSSLAEVRGLGTTAVRAGVDHLLLVVAIVLPTALVAAGRRWSDGAPSVGAALLRASRLLGTLAIAHVITLWLVGLGVVDLPDRLVATLVAAALLAAALGAVAGAVRPRLTRFEIPVVAAIGLIQGLGLGQLFVADRLDRSRPLLSLVAFSLGVEIAVVIIAALTLAPLLLLGRTRLAPLALFGGAAALSAYAVVWLAERIGNATWETIDEFANPFRVWPRNLWIILLLTAALAGLVGWAGSRGRLRPLAEPNAGSDVRPGGGSDVSSRPDPVASA